MSGRARDVTALASVPVDRARPPAGAVETRGVDAQAVLADVAGIGPYFAMGTGPATRGERPLADLRTVPQPLRDRITHVGRALGCDERVAASLAFQGLAAQLVSAPYAAAVLHAAVPALTPASVCWRRADDGGWILRTSASEVVAADRLAVLLDGLLTPLVVAVRGQVPVAERLLWGNAASAVAAAKRVLVLQRPVVADQAAEVAEAVLDAGPFARAGELLPPRDPDRVWTFRRRSCCLYYRVPGGGLCDDCVLTRRPG